MESFHASENCFEEFDPNPNSKELGHHFSPHKDLCLSLINTENLHYLYEVEIPEGPYWEMFDIANWTEPEDFASSLYQSTVLNGDQKLHQQLMEAIKVRKDPQDVVEVLQKAGYVGISYFNEHEVGKSGRESYLVFSEEDIEVLDRKDIPGQAGIDI